MQHYKEIVTIAKKYSEVLTEFFADKTLTAEGTQKASGDIWSNDIRWIGQADAVIAEVTNPSLGVGYEISAAEKMGKPILCLFRPSSGRTLSAMIGGSPGATILEYEDLVSAEHAIAAFISNLRQHPKAA